VMFWYDHNMGWWGYAGMGIGMVLFWALLIVGIVALVRYAATDRQTPPYPTPPPTPEQVLADRFARGEISETEYRDRLAVLRDHTRL
jgi:putative membrane protein